MAKHPFIDLTLDSSWTQAQPTQAKLHGIVQTSTCTYVRAMERRVYNKVWVQTTNWGPNHPSMDLTFKLKIETMLEELFREQNGVSS